MSRKVVLGVGIQRTSKSPIPESDNENSVVEQWHKARNQVVGALNVLFDFNSCQRSGGIQASGAPQIFLFQCKVLGTRNSFEGQQGALAREKAVEAVAEGSEIGIVSCWIREKEVLCLASSSSPSSSSS